MEEQGLSQFLSPSLLEFTRERNAKAVKAISAQEMDAWLANLPDISAVGEEGSDIQTYEEAFSNSNFAAVNSSELKQLQEKNTNKSTMKTTMTWLNRLKNIRQKAKCTEDSTQVERHSRARAGYCITAILCGTM